MATQKDENNKINKDNESLLHWAIQMGISDSSSSSSCLGHSLFISTFTDAGGRGLSAARDLKKGELVLRVPREALLTSDSVLRDEKVAACVKQHTLLSSTQILTVCLLAEVGKGRCSRWYPYLIQLPRCYHTLANFLHFEAQALQVEDAIYVAEKAALKSKSDWKMAIALMRELELKPQLLTYRSWLWASSTITSRTLHIAWDDAGCLCPVGDLFNYAAPDEEVCSEDLGSSLGALQFNDAASEQCNGTINQSDAEQLESYSQRLTDGGYEENMTSYCFYAREKYKEGEQAREKYKEGEQVLLSYGTYTNLELLEHYGFLLDVNPNDKVFIQLTVDMQTISSWPKDALYIQPDGTPSFALLCTLRLWATPANLRRSVGHRAYSGSMVSARNEISAMKWLANRCRTILAELPTAVEDDESLLVIIDEMLDRSSYVQCTELPSFEGELDRFFQENGLQKERISGHLLSVKAKRSLERWRLAVRWRRRHKKVMLNCVSYCNLVMDSVSSDSTLGEKMDLCLIE